MKVRRRFIHITPVKLPSAVETFKPHGRTVAAMARSTYYWVKQMGRVDKYSELKEVIRQISEEYQGRYGYRRITLELRNRGYICNHKTVLRLMNGMGLKKA
ncbi:hypothetical protein GCM10020331_092320 [Ectobacillus funiculus]